MPYKMFKTSGPLEGYKKRADGKMKIKIEKGLNRPNNLFPAEAGFGAGFALFPYTGADVNAKDNEGRTALHVAAENGNIEAIKLLIDNGDLTIKKSKGQTAAEAAKEMGYPEIAALRDKENGLNGLKPRREIRELLKEK